MKFDKSQDSSWNAFDCVRKFEMHFGGWETAKELFLHFVLLNII